MIRRSFLWRLFTGYALLVALVAVIFVLTVVPSLRGAYETDTESSLASQATLLSEIVKTTLVQLDLEGIEGPAAIEHPLGRVLGQPGDVAGQTAVLRAALRVVQALEQPGVVDLPFEWPERPSRVKTHPAESPPLVLYATAFVPCYRPRDRRENARKLLYD